jgi:hypothetical protein
MTQERMAELNTRKIRRGETTKAPPFGYRSVKYAIGSPARLIPDPVEQGAITRMFSLRFQEQFRQMSLRQIAEKLTQEGHRPRRSTAFTGESIRQILSREYEFRMRVHGTLNIPESLIQRYVDLCMPFIVPSSQIERYLMTDKTGRVTYNGMYEDTSQEIEKIQFFSVKQGAKRKKRALPETATILDLHLMLLDQEKETERLARHIIDQETMSRRSVADIESKEFRKLLEMVITSEMRLDSKMSGVRVSLSEDLKTAEIRYRIHIEEKSIVEGYNEMNDSIALEMRLNVMQLKRKLDQYAPKKVPTAMPVKG